MDRIKDAIEEIKKGEMIIVVDDENRENEGDLLMAAEFATPEAINFMAKHGRGLICVPMEEDRLKALDIHRMIDQTSDPRETAFTVSVDLKGVSTGISAFERSATIMGLIDEQSSPKDFIKPGHIFPLAAKTGGVLVRDGHTEAAVDFAKLAGLKPAGVICEIMKEDGRMARLDDLKIFAKVHDLKLVSIQDLIAYRKKNQTNICRVSEAALPTKYGFFKVRGYRDQEGQEHLALIKGPLTSDMLVRVHSECMTGDVFASSKCDCGDQLEYAMKAIAQTSGIIIYLRQEGRGIGLVNKIQAYALQDQGLDTVDANTRLGFSEDGRSYDFAVDVLKDLGVEKIRLMTNNPDKVTGLNQRGIEVVERIPIITQAKEDALSYMTAKKNKMGHIL